MNALTYTDEALAEAERLAWREAARCWAEYRVAAAVRDTNPETSIEASQARLAQALHDAAWSAEMFWRSLHDERMARQDLRS